MMKKILMSEFKECIRTTGRTFYHKASDTLYMNWSGAAVEFTFTGTTLIGEFSAMAGIEYEGIPGDTSAPTHFNWPWIAVYVDGTLAFKKEIENEQPVLLASFAEEQTAQIRIVKLTENLKTEIGIVSMSCDGRIQAETSGVTAGRKRIEFVGDSITCGFGDATKERDRLFYTSDEDATISHGVLAAQELGMEYSLVSVSGICATRNAGLPMEYAMDELYEFTDRVIQDKLGEADYEAYNFVENKNDYVVLNLGTNDATGISFCPDYAAELENFVRGYRALIEKIRTCNGPDTYIICALGSLGHYLYADIRDIVEAYKIETGDNRISCFRYMQINPMDGMGACGHPSAITQAKMAKEIAAEIRKTEG